jgi:hypothetical protein
MTYNLSYVTRNKIDRDCNGLFICPFCSESFKSLVYHTRQVHNINARQLRLMFNLPFNFSLEIEDVKQNRREKALLYSMDKNLLIWGKNKRFIKGIKQNKKLTEAISRGHRLKNRGIRVQEIIL